MAALTPNQPLENIAPSPQSGRCADSVLSVRDWLVSTTHSREAGHSALKIAVLRLSSDGTPATLFLRSGNPFPAAGAEAVKTGSIV
jgi:hypothetical protein